MPLCASIICAVWSPASKWLTSWFSFVVSNCELSLSHWYILGQVWYLIVSIPDLCTLTYFKEKEKLNNLQRLYIWLLVHYHPCLLVSWLNILFVGFSFSLMFVSYSPVFVFSSCF